MIVFGSKTYYWYQTKEMYFKQLFVKEHSYLQNYDVKYR